MPDHRALHHYAGLNWCTVRLGLRRRPAEASGGGLPLLSGVRRRRIPDRWRQVRPCPGATGVVGHKWWAGAADGTGGGGVRGRGRCADSSPRMNGCRSTHPMAGHRLTFLSPRGRKSRLRTQTIDGARLLQSLGTSPEEGHLRPPSIRRRGPDARQSVPEPVGRDQRGAPLLRPTRGGRRTTTPQRSSPTRQVGGVPLWFSSSRESD